MSLMVIDSYRFASSSGPTVALTDSDTDSSNSLTYTFTNKDIGTASATRLVVVGVVIYDSSNNTIGSVTIGGSAATEVVQSTTNESVSGLYQRVVTSGTTATIVVNVGGGSAQHCAIKVYSVDNYSSSTATDTASQIDSDPASGSLDISAGGIAIAIAGAWDATSATWTNLSEDSDTVVETVLLITSASSSFATVQTGLSISCNFAGASNSEQSIAMASWR